MSQYHRQTQNGKVGNKKKENEGDEFMRLVCGKSINRRCITNRIQSDGEIAGCISDIGVPFSPDDLQRPQPVMVQRVFEWFAELLMNTTRETVEPAMREAAKDVCGEDMMDIIPTETRNLMGFYASLRKLLIEVRYNVQNS